MIASDFEQSWSVAVDQSGKRYFIAIDRVLLAGHRGILSKKIIDQVRSSCDEGRVVLDHLTLLTIPLATAHERSDISSAAASLIPEHRTHHPAAAQPLLGASQVREMVIKLDADMAKVWLDDPALTRIIAAVGEPLAKTARCCGAIAHLRPI